VAPGQGTLTPGNSTPLTDGASAVLLGSEEWAKARNLPVLAYITFVKWLPLTSVNKKEGLLMAPGLRCAAHAATRGLDPARLRFL
jgi:acetyl-CoA C-acetyltransferase